MRVELTHHVTDDTGTLRECLVGAVAAVEHGVDHAAVHGLQAVAHIGQGSPDDDAHRVVEVGALHFELQVDLVDLAVLHEVRGCRCVGGRGVCGAGGACVFARVLGGRFVRCQGSARPSRSFG